MIQFPLEIVKHPQKYIIFRYILVGGISTLIHFVAAFCFIYIINASVFQSNLTGFLVAYVFSYLMQSKLVFRHEISFKKAGKYFIVQFTALLIAIASSNLFDSYNSYVQTAIIVILLPLVTFILHKFWTFENI